MTPVVYTNPLGSEVFDCGECGCTKTVGEWCDYCGACADCCSGDEWCVAVAWRVREYARQRAYLKSRGE